MRLRLPGRGLLSRGVRSERLARWKELCLRLELTPEPGEERAASGQLQGIDFRLCDTGSALLLELPLPQPLLPSGVVLLSRKARRLRPPHKLRPLPLRVPFPQPPEAPAWSVDRRLPPSRAEASPAFLEEAHRAAQAWAPLRVEPRRLVRALPGDVLPPVSEVRDAVRTLDATARHWLQTVEAHGLPRLEAVRLPPSPWVLLRGVLVRRDVWGAALAHNGGISVLLVALMLGGPWAFFGLLLVALLALWAVVPGRYGRGAFVLCLLALATSSTAAWMLERSLSVGTSPSVLSVRDAPLPQHQRAHHFRFRDAVLRTDLAAPSVGSLTPILPVDWRPGEPVTAWAIRPFTSPAAPPTLGGVAVEPRSTNGYREAALHVALARQLPMHPKALFLDLSVNPDVEQALLRNRALFWWGCPHFLMLAVVLSRWSGAWRAARRKHAAELLR